MNDEGFSEEEIFGRPLQDIQLEDLIAEIRARLKVDEAVWQRCSPLCRITL